MISRSLQIAEHRFQVDIYGNEFILMKSESFPNLPLLAQAIYQQHYSGFEEVIGSEKEICLKLSEAFSIADLADLESLQIENSKKSTSYWLPVYFPENEDWLLVEDQTKLNRKEAITLIRQSELRLCMYGFLPGFLYMDGLPTQLQLSRKSQPSTRVPQGTLALGGKYLGLYNLASPAGWYNIGRCPLSTFTLDQDVIDTIPIGSLIKIKAINLETYEHLAVSNINLKTYNRNGPM